MGNLLRRFLLFWAVSLFAGSLLLGNRTAGQTPPMGYNSWYCCGTIGAEAERLRAVYRWMAAKGVQNAGFTYIVVDDGWAQFRDINGAIIPNGTKFPDGLPEFIDEVHTNGFKFGLYTTYGPLTCALLPGSQGHLERDARTYAQWGVDYVKIEGCNSMSNEERRASVETFAAALFGENPNIFLNLSIAEFGGFEPWMPSIVNSWRGTGDWILERDGLPGWTNVLQHIDYAASTPDAVGPGRFYDPDVVMPTWDRDVNKLKAEFGMYAMLCCPLLLPGTGFFDYELEVLTNASVIAINQDPAVIQARAIWSNELATVYARPLGSPDGPDKAVAFLNRGTENPVTLGVAWSEIGLPAGVATVRDLWAQSTCAFSNDSFTVTVPPNTAWLYKISSGLHSPFADESRKYLSDLPWMSGSYNAAGSMLNLPIMRDRSAATTPLQINRTFYSKGLGLMANSHLRYFLGGLITRFHADLGVDEAGAGAEIRFLIWGDGSLLHDSGVLRHGSPPQTVDLSVSGFHVLTIEATNAREDQVFNQAYANLANAWFLVEPTFWIRSLTLAESGLVLTCKTVVGQVYVVESSPDLVDWTAATDEQTASDTVSTFTLPAADEGLFLRIRQVQ